MSRHLLISGATLVLLVVGCAEQDMARQPRADPYEGSTLFPDGKAARPLVPGTIARGQLRTESHLFRGQLPSQPHQQATLMLGMGPRGPLSLAGVSLAGPGLADIFPFTVNSEVVARGKQRFEIFCAVCHGPSGYGDGRIVERGFTRPPSYHEPRLREAPVGHLVQVMTRGYGAMPELSSEVSVRDRWAIAAYIRVLQASQGIPLNELTPEQREQLRNSTSGGRHDSN